MQRDHPHFLVATDMDPAAAPHVEFAVRFGDALGARSTLFHALMPRPIIVGIGAPPAVLPATDDEVVATARERLLAMAGGVATRRPVHVAVVAASDPRDAILAAAERIEAEMILVPTHGRTGLERAVLGSTAEQVLRRSKRPVLLVTDRMLHRTPSADAERGPVVVATDLSPAAVVAHRPAAELAKRLGLPLLFLSVLPARQPPPFGGGAPVAPPPSDPQARIHERAVLLREHAVGTGVEVPAEVRVSIDDDTSGAIVESAATVGAELLVLATHGRSGLARMVKGSVAEQVVRHSTVPVVCMPVPRG